MKIAIFGGSFDPPHLGHDIIVQNALKELDIDRLFILLAWLNPFKKSFFAPPKTRLKWVQTLWGDTQKVDICTYEIDNKRPTTTFESVVHLYQMYDIKKCYLIIGADNVKDLPKWANYEKLSQMVEFVVASRDEKKIPKGLKKLQINANISSTKLRNSFDANLIPKTIAKDVEKFYKRNKVNQTIEKIIDFLDSKKAENIQVFDMKGKDYFTDNVIIATTLGERHSNALLDDLSPILKQLGETPLQVESSGEWVVMDLGDILIHLMSSEYRSKYNIESFLGDFEKLRDQGIKEV